MSRFLFLSKKEWKLNHLFQIIETMKKMRRMIINQMIEKKKHNENYPNTKKFSKLRKNNLVYYFKIPELVLLYYKFLKVSIRVEEQTVLKSYLADIYVN